MVLPSRRKDTIMANSLDEDRMRSAWEDEQRATWEQEHLEQIEAQAKAEWVAGLCEGHESLRGDMMGATDYCDGTCRPARERDDDAYLAYLEQSLPDD
jgi:hypothetical protein